MTYQEFAAKFGEVSFQGRKYALTEMAFLASSCLSSPLGSYHDVDDGEEYQFDMQAEVVDSDGALYRSQWIFTAVKGSEPDLDTYDFSVADRIWEV